MALDKTAYSNSDLSKDYNWWFVVGHTINGGRFYSESFTNYSSAQHCYNEFKTLVDYFGGGYVELLNISEYDYDVVAFSHI